MRRAQGRRSWVLLGAWLLLVGVARGEDPAVLAPWQAAERAKAAVAARDTSALQALAAQDAPDPWLVADFLLGRGEAATALAFARAAPRKDVEALAPYVEARQPGGIPDDAALRALLEEAERAAYGGEHLRAEALLADAHPAADDVLAVRVHFDRAQALFRLERAGEAAAAWREAAERAQALGWLARVASSYELAARASLKSMRVPEAILTGRKLVEVQVARGRRTEAADALVAIGWALSQLGLTKEGFAEIESALAMFAEDGDRPREAANRAFLAGLRMKAGQNEEALVDLARARVLYDELGDVKAAGQAAKDSAWACFALGRVPEALAAAEEALELSTRAGHQVGIAEAHAVLGAVVDHAGRPEEALDHYTQALALYEKAGDATGIASARGNLAWGLYQASRFDEARALAESVVETWTAQGDPARLADAYGLLASCVESLGDLAEGMAYREASLRAAEASGDAGALGRALEKMASARIPLGDLEAAATFLDRGDALARRTKDAKLQVSLLIVRSSLEVTRGDLGAALAHGEEAVRIAEASGLVAQLSQALGEVAIVQWHMGRRDLTLETGLRGLEIAERNHLAVLLPKYYADYAALLGESGRLEEAFAQLAKAEAASVSRALDARTVVFARSRVNAAAGDFARARLAIQAALRVLDPEQDALMYADLLFEDARALRAMGDFGPALATLDEVVRRRHGTGDVVGTLQAQAELVDLMERIGDPEGALAALEAPLAQARQTGCGSVVPSFLAVRGRASWRLGRRDEALASLQEALEVARPNGEAAVELGIAAELSRMHREAGDAASALKDAEAVVARSRELGLRRPLAEGLRQLGLAQAASGRDAEALATLGEAVQQAERFRGADVLVRALGDTAWLQLRAGRAELALATLHRATPYLEQLFRGQSEEQGSIVRGEFSDVAEIGVWAAVAADDLGEVVHFLEQGRAGRLLESLSRGDASADDGIPAELLEAERDTRVAEAEALRAWSLALDGNDLRETRRRKQELDRARRDRQKAIERIERANQMRALLYYPRVADVRDMQRALGREEALVLYALLADRADGEPGKAFAVVLTSKKARLVRLGRRADVDVLVEAAAFEGPGQDRAKALVELRAAVLDPLELPEEVTRLLISPNGSLSYVPWAALAGERQVALVPSGTVHVTLGDLGRERGERVLALGDPRYDTPDAGDPGPGAVAARAGALTPLPGTRQEVEAVGDVRLLAEDATIPRLLEALGAQRRWRAVHLACHGLVDRGAPMLSALAVTPTAEDDGFLTAIELTRVHVDADLVVLSACDTGRGSVVQGEGILGLARAFMHAGAPRVICSLWKVDDEATQALMVELYRLWSPASGRGLPLAEALRRAQAHVRSQPRWEDPYYWAAWVLWGLPG